MNLNDPTPADEIKSRQGPGGRSLDYIDARFVMDRLDGSVGPENWQDKYEDLPNGSVRCGIGIRFSKLPGIGTEFIWKWDVGDTSDIEPTKGAHSDAFKRAGVKWGIGRDLYGDHATSHGNAPKPPAKAPLRSVPQDEEPPFPMAVVADATFAAAEKIFGDMLPDESKCPDHGYDWKTNSRGYFCSGKTNGKWCERKPSKAWAAAQELVPAS